MKVAIIVNLFPPKWKAGTEIATYNLAKALSKKNEVHVITTHDNGIEDSHLCNNFIVHRISYPIRPLYGKVIFLIKIAMSIITLRPDIVHVQSLKMGLPAVCTKLLLKMPFIVWGRGDDVYQEYFGKGIMAHFSLKYADARIALTDDMNRAMRKLYDLPVITIPNGIDTNRFNVEYPGDDSNTKTIITVARLYPVKGIKYAIIAMDSIRKVVPNSRLLIVGEGEEKEELLKLCADLNLNNQIRFIGEIPNSQIPSHLSLADVFLLPSLSEGFPVSILEAMAAGLPIVASNIGGIPEIVIEGKNGYLANPKDPNGIADRVIRILSNDQLRKEMGNNSYTLSKKYNWDTLAEQVEEIYSKIVA